MSISVCPLRVMRMTLVLISLISLALRPAQSVLAATNTASDIQITVTSNGVQIVVTNNDADGYIVPDVYVSAPGARGELTYLGKQGCEMNTALPCGTYQDYWNYAFTLLACSSVVVTAVDGNIIHASYNNPCSVRGTAFEDLNANGKRDPGEPPFGGAWYKVTDGGNWFVCGPVGDDATFGVIVNPGVYYILPVNLQGYRVTTPRVKAVANTDAASLGNDIGYIKDSDARLEGCDLYHPARP